jgi:excinuclease ABC subunit B
MRADFDVTETIRELEEEMLAAANNLEFEKAALLRDQIKELKRTVDGVAAASPGAAARISYSKGGKGKKSSRAKRA